MNSLTKQKETHRLREWTYGCQGLGCGEGIVRGFWMDMNILLCLKWITSKDPLYSTGNSALCYVAAWMGGEFGGEWIHVYIWLSESLHCLPETITILLISYTPIQNKKLKKKFKYCFS